MTENTYWENNGKYQKEYDQLFEKLVPAMGRAETSDGELLRSISNLYYDLFNNGWCNWDIYLLERGIVARFLQSMNYRGRINWHMPQDYLPDFPVVEFENEIEKIADLIIKHLDETILSYKKK